MTELAQWGDTAGIAVLHMSLLEAAGGVQAIFTGRHGGSSDRWGDGLNWSYSVGDEPASVAENRRRTLALLGLTPSSAVMAGLVHGSRVVPVTGTEAAGRGGVRLVEECDALITDRPGLALIVTAADCVPLYLYDPVKRAVGVAHAGWRGTVAGIGGCTVRAMSEQYGCRPADIRAMVGPSIGPCCYEVGEQVTEPLRAHYGPAAEQFLTPAGAPGKYHLDLWAANQFDLKTAGVPEPVISGNCSSCGVDKLFSHRAEAGAAGRGAAVIAMDRQ